MVANKFEYKTRKSQEVTRISGLNSHHHFKSIRYTRTYVFTHNHETKHLNKKK